MSTQATPLALRDIHLPDPISWWPPALGWWLLLLLTILLTLGWLFWHRQAKRYQLRRTALAELTRIAQQHAQNPDDRLLAAQLSMLLRRICLQHYPRDQVAGVSGTAWLQFLDQPLPDRPFSQGEGQVLIRAPFEPMPRLHPEALLTLCRRWILALPPHMPTKSCKPF
ncbi:MAG: DUF4381 domain-containing protein [Magnetococcales bacterium]|nr:DUF4381 domain-containing protein [Magnetococcales bacterium]NGZ06917.1 DUF4381 domain-containing protein [Magnetococcales bacterium]